MKKEDAMFPFAPIVIIPMLIIFGALTFLPLWSCPPDTDDL
jgi:hypothetical protein